MIIGSAEHLAWLSRIQHGNHDNALLIDAPQDQALYELAVLHGRTIISILNVDISSLMVKAPDPVGQPTPAWMLAVQRWITAPFRWIGKHAR